MESTEAELAELERIVAEKREASALRLEQLNTERQGLSSVASRISEYQASLTWQASYGKPHGRAVCRVGHGGEREGQLTPTVT